MADLPGYMKPGTITRGRTEYIFCCWVCAWTDTFLAIDEQDAIKMAGQVGWFVVGGKWRCNNNHQQIRKFWESEATENAANTGATTC